MFDTGLERKFGGGRRMMQLKEAISEAGIVRPKQAAIMLTRGKTTLENLTKWGIALPIAGKGKDTTRVRFEQIGKPFYARPATGWVAVKVRSSFGALSNLLLEEGSVSGILRVRR
jgi:hypothetical protein